MDTIVGSSAFTFQPLHILAINVASLAVIDHCTNPEIMRQTPRYLERQKAREERDAAQAAEEGGGVDTSSAGPSSSSDAPPLPPYAADLLTLDQLLTCLRKQVPADDKGGTQQGEKKAVEVPQGRKGSLCTPLHTCDSRFLLSCSWHISCEW